MSAKTEEVDDVGEGDQDEWAIVFEPGSRHVPGRLSVHGWMYLSIFPLPSAVGRAQLRDFVAGVGARAITLGAESSIARNDDGSFMLFCGGDGVVPAISVMLWPCDALNSMFDYMLQSETSRVDRSHR